MSTFIINERTTLIIYSYILMEQFCVIILR